MCFEDYLIERTDELNNAVYALLRCFLMLNGAEADDAFPWNMEIIAQPATLWKPNLFAMVIIPATPIMREKMVRLASLLRTASERSARSAFPKVPARMGCLYEKAHRVIKIQLYLQGADRL